MTQSKHNSTITLERQPTRKIGCNDSDLDLTRVQVHTFFHFDVICVPRGLLTPSLPRQVVILVGLS